ncbi:MAG: hypothetical protein IKZ34_03535 [Alphaproteobacteria bacterium]|nr:hypothetical protein [Alphaproteobacteria bacterium]
MPSFSAISNGCADDDNAYIIPSIALCTTHAYNYNMDKNPGADERSAMQDIIALKTTVISQQMYKQYEYLEAMIRRLKTQLEKATLTASLQAAGASSSASDADSNSGSGWRSKDNDIFMEDGIENCNDSNSMNEMFDCVVRNVDIIKSVVSDGVKPTKQAKQQLIHEKEVIEQIKFDSKATVSSSTDESTDVLCPNLNKRCSQTIQRAPSMSNTAFSTCLDEVRNCIRNLNQERDNLEKKYKYKDD